MTTSITLPSHLLKAMVAHAREDLPNECCGVILGREGNFQRLISIRNICPSPDAYLMDPEQQVEVFSAMSLRGEELLGIYHSHPDGPPSPSGIDISLAFHAEAVYFIVSLEDKKNPEVRAFKLAGNEFKEIPLHTNE